MRLADGLPARAMARLLILGGGTRGRRLAAVLASEGHASRIVTRTPAGRDAIESAGAECWIGTPERLATLSGALEGVTIVCWLLSTARGDEAQVRALHGARLQAFLAQAIDTTMRGFVYEAPRSWADLSDSEAVPPTAGERIVRAMSARNAIPVALIRADPIDPDEWLADARGAVAALLGVPPDPGCARPAQDRADVRYPET
jgi:hypothetical protein